MIAFVTLRPSIHKEQRGAICMEHNLRVSSANEGLMNLSTKRQWLLDQV